MLHFNPDKYVLLKSIYAMILVVLLTGCNVFQEMSNVGEPPEMRRIENPVLIKGYKPVSMPMPAPKESASHINSLWQEGSRAFFKDQRASKVGDVVTVDIKFESEAKIDSTFQIARTSSQSLAIPNMYGYEKYLGNVFPSAVNKNALVTVGSSPSVNALGKRDSKDKMDVKIAATIIQILPNGNMVIQGRRELRISGEVKTLELRGIIRREDIIAGNRIKYSKIAEARISDVTKGEMSDLNQPAWGQEILDKLEPF